MRRIVTAMAVLGVLLHSALLVRHAMTVVSKGWVAASAVVAAANDMAQLEADLTVICHAPSGAEASPNGVPAKSGECPMCTGLCSAVALTAPEFWVVALSLPTSQTFNRPLDQRVEHHKRIRPPGRGPPHLA